MLNRKTQVEAWVFSISAAMYSSSIGAAFNDDPLFSVGVFYNTNRILSGSIERSKADLEKFKRSIRRCKIEFLQSGCQGTASPGVADPMEIGLAVWPGQSPGEDWEAVWLGKAH